MRVFEATFGPSAPGGSIDYVISESLPDLKFLCVDTLITTAVGSTPNANFVIFNKALQVRFAVATAGLTPAATSRVSFAAVGVATNNTNVLTSPTPNDMLLLPGDIIRLSLLNQGGADVIGAALLTFELLPELALDVFDRLPR